MRNASTNDQPSSHDPSAPKRRNSFRAVRDSKMKRMSRTVYAVTRYLVYASWMVIVLSSSAIHGVEETPDAVRKQYSALVAEFEDDRRPREFVPRFFAFAKANRGHNAAIDALVWIVNNRRYRPETARAIQQLAEHHLEKKRLSLAFDSLGRIATPEAERLLRSAMKENPHTEVQARACYELTLLLSQQSRLHEQLQEQPAMRKRAEQYYGSGFANHLILLNPDKLARERERLFERLAASFASVPHRDTTLGQIAKKELFAIRHLSIGRTAPEIQAEDIDGVPFRLSDHRGKIVVVSFWGHW